MNRREFWVKYAQKNDISQAKAEQICKSVFSLLAESITAEDRVYIAGLGTFKKKTIKAHRIKDVNTGNMIELPEKEKIVFEITEQN